MKRTTRKLSGQAKDRFLDQLLLSEPALETDVRARLLARLKTAFSSVRVHRSAKRMRTKVSQAVVTAAAAPPMLPVVAAGQGKPVLAATLPSAPAETHAAAMHAADTRASSVSAAAFDPYVFGLVPIFQREGRDGLLAKLATVQSLDHLRQMAKAQQVVLPQEMRSGDVTADAVRAAVADAVAKRVADRRAAAG